MNTCNRCGKTFEKYSKLVRHSNNRNPCRPPTHHCDNCKKGFASYQSLWKHKQKCRRPSPNYVNFPVGQKRPADISTNSLEIHPTLDAVAEKESCLESRPKNPKIQALVDEIVNDGDIKRYGVPPQEIHWGFSIVPPTATSPSVMKEVSTPSSTSPSTSTPLSKKMLFSSPPPPKQMLPKPSTEVITAAVLPSLSNILSTTASSPRTKGDIVGYSNGESSEDEDTSDGVGESSSDDESMSSKSDNSDDNMGVVETFVLPDTIEGMRDRFNELYVGFVRKGQHENRTELEFLLDELLRQGAIDPTEYTQLNSGLTVKEDLTTDKEEKEEIDEDKEEDNMTNSTIQYLIRHDKEELQDLLEEIKDDIDEEEFKDIIHDIEKLLETFFVEAFVDGEIIRPKINILLKQLESSSKIAKSKQHRLHMLLDDIEKNRYRVEQIFERLMDAENKDEMLHVLKTLVREEHLSDEQFEQLAELEDPDLDAIKAVITETKIGEGLKFLPRTITHLRHTLQSLLAELKENGNAFLKSKITAIMEELLRRHAIRDEEYENLKKLTI